MSPLVSRTALLLSRASVPIFRVSRLSASDSRSIVKTPAFMQRLFDKLSSIEENIDEEAKVGANLPFSIENPRKLALKMILFIGIAFNIPFFITYHQMKSSKT